MTGTARLGPELPRKRGQLARHGSPGGQGGGEMGE